VFRLEPPAAPGGEWAERILYIFGGAPDGSVPNDSLVFGQSGELFGTTYAGGTSNLGSVFELAPPAAPGAKWTETVLYSFGTRSGDGFNPMSGPIKDKNGNLYGTNQGDGVTTFGTVYEISPPASRGAWTETLVFSAFSSATGYLPTGPVSIDREGNLYGTAYSGGSCVGEGSSGCGTVFELTPPTSPGGAWNETVLYYFTGLNGDGANPEAGVVIGADGTLYGTTLFGGTGDYGTVFWLAPPTSAGGAWAETVVPLPASTGGSPAGGLSFGSGGVLYGNTGTAVFQVTR